VGVKKEILLALAEIKKGLAKANQSFSFYIHELKLVANTTCASKHSAPYKQDRK
jgi:hypothetical protein